MRTAWQAWQRRASAAGEVPAAGAGLVAAGTALAVGELVGALTGEPPSLVTAVGDEFIDRFAGSLKDLAVSLFGQNDKVALVVGIVVVSLALGTGLGVLARRRFGLAAAGFAAFGLLGLWSGLRDPLGSTATVWLASVAAVLAGVTALGLLLYLAPSGNWPVRRANTAGEAADAEPEQVEPVAPALEDPRNPRAARRQFLSWGGAVAAWSVLAAAGSRSLRARSSVESERAATVLPAPARPARALPGQPLDVPGITPYIMPNDAFYKIDTALTVPQIEAGSWRLQVDGMVDEPFELTYDELLAMTLVEVPVTLTCVSNYVGGDLVGNANWLGVPLSELLERAGVQPEATQIVGESLDGFTAGFPTEVALDGRTALVAVGMNGEPLPTGHGYPARLVVAGLYGYVSATKWLGRIHLTTWEDFDGYWIPRGWAKEGPIKLASRIDVPGDGDTVPAGMTAVAGVAWSPSVGIAEVQVRVDDGPWEPAELGGVVSDDTWVQWLYRWDAPEGEHELRVRAVDKDGEVQTGDEVPPQPDGATGWHERTVNVET